MTTISTSELADRLGVNRKTIAQWRKEKRPGVPDKVGSKEPWEAWDAWQKANPDAGYYDGKPSVSREDALTKKALVETEIKEIQRDKLQGKLIHRDEVAELLTKAGMSINVFLRRYEREIPAICLGLPLSQAIPATKAKTRELQEEWSNLESEFWKEHEEKI